MAYVITNRAGQFRGDTGWVNEYPDAKQFQRWSYATAEAAILGKNTRVIENYGFATQKTVWSSEPEPDPDDDLKECADCGASTAEPGGTHECTPNAVSMPTNLERTAALVAGMEGVADVDDGHSDDCHKKTCGLCKARQHVTIINVRLEARGKAGAALDVVDRVLDAGIFQDAINEWECDEMVHVLDASVREEAPAVSPTGLPLCPTCGQLKSHHTNPVAHKFGEPWKNPYRTNECAKALGDVVDLIWPPGFDRPDDDALASTSAVLAAIMRRLAFLKPSEGAGPDEFTGPEDPRLTAILASCSCGGGGCAKCLGRGGGR